MSAKSKGNPQPEPEEGATEEQSFWQGWVDHAKAESERFRGRGHVYVQGDEIAALWDAIATLLEVNAP